jgi:TonB family protein
LILSRDSVTGDPKRVAVIESDLPRSIQRVSRALVYKRVRGPAEDRSRARLRIDLGSEPYFRTGATEMCRPALRNRAEVQALLHRSLKRAEVSLSAIIWVYIDQKGSVERVKVQRSSGNPDFDKLASSLGYRMEFHAALNDRVAIPVWIAIPVSSR